MNAQHILSDRIQAMVESQTIGMAKKARQLAAQGHDVINLSFGEPDFVTPAHICQAAKDALDQGYTFYTPVAGYPDLKKAIAAKLLRDNHISYEPENIVVSTGAKQSIANLVLCMLNPGDEALIIAPYWVSYLEIVRLAEANPIIIKGEIENNYKPSIAEVEAAISPKTKLIMYSSPSNPTGAMWDKSEMDAFAAMLLRHPHVYVMADEIYEYISYGTDHISLASYASIKERVITINGFSKGFAMTGWRVGYMAAEKWIADACDKMQGQFTSGTCSIAQRAAIVALNSDLSTTIEMKDAFARRRTLMMDLLAQIPDFETPLPDGAFYLFPRVNAYFGKRYQDQIITNADELCMYLLNHAHVSLVTGEAFGAPDCIRISFAASDEKLVDACGRITKALAQLV